MRRARRRKGRVLRSSMENLLRAAPVKRYIRAAATATAPVYASTFSTGLSLYCPIFQVRDGKVYGLWIVNVTRIYLSFRRKIRRRGTRSFAKEKFCARIYLPAALWFIHITLRFNVTNKNNINNCFFSLSFFLRLQYLFVEKFSVTNSEKYCITRKKLRESSVVAEN